MNKPLDDFYQNGPRPRGSCKPCFLARQAANPQWRRGARSANAKRRYGVNLDALLAAQNGLCANPACDAPATDVDHDHLCCPTRAESCGECVRGILCGGCNRALGSVNDDVLRLYGLIEFLNKWSGKNE